VAEFMAARIIPNPPVATTKPAPRPNHLYRIPLIQRFILSPLFKRFFFRSLWAIPEDLPHFYGRNRGQLHISRRLGN